MRSNYYTIETQFEDARPFVPGEWLVDFPPWLFHGIDFRSPTLIGSRWNPRNFAFASHFGGVEPHPKPDFPRVVEQQRHAASRRLQEALSRIAPEAFEFLPFRTRTSIGEDITNEYALLHYLVWEDAVDKKRSVLAPHESRFRRSKAFGGDYILDRVVLSRQKLTQPICRVLGWSPYHLYREDVVNDLRKQNITGMDFKEVEVA